MLIKRAVAILGATVLLASVAYAASISLGSGSLGADQELVPRCTTAGLGVLQNVTGTTATSVTVSNLPAGCAGAAIQVTVNNQVTSSSGSSTVPAGGGSATVTLAIAIAITAVEQVDLVISGP